MGGTTLARTEGPLKILLVDENEDYLLAFEGMLLRECATDDQFRIERATGRESAVEALIGNSFDVCFVAENCAGWEGLDILRTLENHTLRTAFIFLTDQPNKTTAYTALRYGAMDYLIKTQIDSFGLLKSLAFSLFRKSKELELRAATLHDSLTGLGNRALFREQAQKLLQHAKRAREQVAVVFMDVDGLKPVNDSYGHQTGDKVLQMVAGRLVERTRESDIVARVGGDEFIALLVRVDGPQAVARMAGELTKAISDQPFRISEQDIRLGLSCGTALYPDDSENIDELVRLADQRMYDIKARNKKSRSDSQMVWFPQQKRN